MPQHCNLLVKMLRALFKKSPCSRVSFLRHVRPGRRSRRNFAACMKCRLMVCGG
jgi:hypothetical protein